MWHDFDASGLIVPYDCDDGTTLEIPDGHDPVCDGGAYDCPDKSDENDCKNVCSFSQISCNVNGAAACLSESLMCDGHSDCDDGFDETDCSKCDVPEEFDCGVRDLIYKSYGLDQGSAPGRFYRKTAGGKTAFAVAVTVLEFLAVRFKSVR